MVGSLAYSGALAGQKIGVINHIEIGDSPEFIANLKYHYVTFIYNELQTILNS